MITLITSWVKNIIIAIIIGTVIEMILPDNKNKKYIKMIIGIYILFCIINPIIGKKINLNELALENYTSISSTNIISSNDIDIDKTYKEKMIENIKSKLENNGYDSNNINIESNSNYNLTSITINEIYEYKENAKTSINEVKINIKDQVTKGITNNDKKKLINALSKTYEVDEKNININ